jgi:hypothetical protein
MLFLDNDAIAALIDPARFVAAQDDAMAALERFANAARRG